MQTTQHITGPGNIRLEVITHMPDGPPKPMRLLCVHGAWHGAWCFADTFLPWFAARGYEISSMSLRGHAGSSGSTRFARLTDYAADLRAVLATYPTPPVVIAHSMGGLLTLMLASEGVKFPGAALLAPLPIVGTVPLVRRFFRTRPVHALRVFLQDDAGYKVNYPETDGKWFLSPEMPSEEAEAVIARFSRESFTATGLEAGPLIGRFHNPAQVATPLLVFAGAYDTLFTPDEIQQTARAYGTMAHILPTMGHDLMLDPGWEAITEQIEVWLQGLGAPD
ncbi:MAG: alpha/beta fold hydrolase [Chloroflexota bacterium]